MFSAILLCLAAPAFSLSVSVDARSELHAHRGFTHAHTSGTHVILVSENQSDTLNASLRCNAQIAGYIHAVTVITSTADVTTQKVARQHGAQVHTTDALHHEKARFNKGLAIREVQMKLHSEPHMEGDRIILTDDDICFPAEAWNNLRDPKPGELLTADRRCIFSKPENIQQGRPSEIRDSHGSPCGYFQLYRLSSDAPLYSDKFTTAAGSDFEYAKSFTSKSTLDIGLVHFGADSHWNGQSKNSSAVVFSVIPPQPLGCPTHVHGVPNVRE